MIFWTVGYTHTQKQIHKYTNTACDEVPEIPNMCYIFESQGSKGMNMIFWTVKYTNTNIQIHKYLK